MSWAYNYKEMLETIFASASTAQCTGPLITPTNLDLSRRTQPSPIAQNLDKAEDLLDEAGWDDSDGDGIRDKEINGRVVPFEFTLNYVTISPIGIAFAIYFVEEAWKTSA